MKLNDVLPMSLLVNKLRTNPTLINSYTKSRVFYTVDITDLYYHAKEVFSKLIKNGRRSANIMTARSLTIELDIGTSTYADVFWYKNMPIIFYKENPQQSDSYTSNRVALITLNCKKFVDNLNKFVECIYHNGPKLSKQIKYTEIILISGSYDRAVQQIIPLDLKTFDDVFIPDDQYNTIVDGIDNFLKNKKFLEEHHIPTHLGILLYGTPGCGRTSIIKALIHKYNARALYLNSLAALPATVKTFASMLNSDELNFIICEDVDCTLFKRQVVKRQKTKEMHPRGYMTTPDEPEENVSLSEVLNSIDGMCAPHNTIFIFTTNVIEELDPALIRPGRMDIRLEIKPICEETLNKFTKKFFGRELPIGYRCKEGELFSTLQLKVMGGATFEDILEFMKEENEDEIDKA